MNIFFRTLQKNYENSTLIILICYTKYYLCFSLEWSTEKGYQEKLEDLSIEELDEKLRLFYAEVRSKQGQDYSKNTLLGIRSGIERYLNGPPHNKGILISQNTAFKRPNMMLTAKLKNLKHEGKHNVQHKPAIEIEDLRNLKTSDAMNPSTPNGLLMNVWFHCTLYWCRRGREGQRNLSKSSFKFLNDENGHPYATMTHDEASKYHPGGFWDQESHEKLGRMYQTDDPNDGFSSLQLYLAMINPKCDAFFQFPKRNWAHPSEAVWYENRVLGVNKLGSMMKELSLATKLSRVYTNHCVRATAITLWSNAGLSNRHIMAISGHRNEQSLQSYNSRPSSNQLQQCSNVLSRALNPVNPVQSSQPLVVPESQHNQGSSYVSQNVLNRQEKFNF